MHTIFICELSSEFVNCWVYSRRYGGIVDKKFESDDLFTFCAFAP